MRRAPVEDHRDEPPSSGVVPARDRPVVPVPYSRMPDDEQLWRRADDVLWRYTGDGLVLLRVASGEPLALDTAGAVVWQELCRPAVLTDLARRTAERVHAEVACVVPGVRALLLDLHDRGLVCRGA